MLDRNWLETRVRSLIEDEEDITPDESLIYFGLDSIRVMEFATELKEQGIAVTFEELASNPTINAWWGLISTRQNAA
ncbi:phosphopantetheine-binding protein [Ruegeria sp. Ofav3-42]|uniref:phosphopantetheine-binding protein n=1 Tax=Ruegeria sp. Ofav3-42 TaxID=2917759 RepID=UPI001EF6E912|nr:phosphopantetheine-binding protein [Ruegeria sp. Ofav3-42]MCG7521800.1 phosphopantetheine-binding protein [Ruegeria sp. Ofav3-42]